MSQGIYKITNKINNKCYIGKSTDIESRWKYHIENKNSIKEYNKPLYRAFRKYGIENFSFEIIEELEDYSTSNEREKYWIQYYDCYGNNKGYNATIGGDGGATCENPRDKFGKITNDDVIYLRKRFAECKYPSSYIYECEFKDKITKRGFQAIWLGENSKDIMPEVFTDENKQKNLQLGRLYEGLLRRRKKISLEQTLEIRERIKKGESRKSIWLSEFKDVYSEGGFRDAINMPSLDERIELNGKLSPL